MANSSCSMCVSESCSPIARPSKIEWKESAKTIMRHLNSGMFPASCCWLLSFRSPLMSSYCLKDDSEASCRSHSLVELICCFCWFLRLPWLWWWWWGSSIQTIDPYAGSLTSFWMRVTCSSSLIAFLSFPWLCPKSGLWWETNAWTTSSARKMRKNPKLTRSSVTGSPHGTFPQSSSLVESSSFYAIDGTEKEN